MVKYRSKLSSAGKTALKMISIFFPLKMNGKVDMKLQYDFISQSSYEWKRIKIELMNHSPYYSNHSS